MTQLRRRLLATVTLGALCGPLVAQESVDELVARAGLVEPVASGPLRLYRATGCDACGHTGYSGRTAILEILKISDAIRKMVLSRQSSSDIRSCAIDEGMLPMRDDGFRKALAGITTIEEVLRVTPEHLT